MPGWWAVKPPMSSYSSARADAILPGAVICPEHIIPLDDETRGHQSATALWGNFLGAIAVNYMRSRKLVVPLAAFRHYGRAGQPVYFGYATGGAQEFAPQQVIHFRTGVLHGACPGHSAELITEMTTALCCFMGYLWKAVGGSNLGDLRSILWTRDERTFKAALSGDLSADVAPKIAGVAYAAGLVSIHASGATGLTPAGAVWYLANQRLAGHELIEDAMPPQEYTVKTGDGSFIQFAARGNNNNVSGDQYVSGVAGAQGPGSRGAIAFDWLPPGASVRDLQEQLSVLRTLLRERACRPEDDISVGAVGEAEVAAVAGDERKLLKALLKAGRWAYQAAREVGLEVAAAALARALGV